MRLYHWVAMHFWLALWHCNRQLALRSRKGSLVDRLQLRLISAAASHDPWILDAPGAQRNRLLKSGERSAPVACAACVLRWKGRTP